MSDKLTIKGRLIAVFVGSLFTVLMTELFLHFNDIRGSNPISRNYRDLLLKKVYFQLSDAEINDLLNETWSRPHIYEPYTQFKERPYKGAYVNVNENGFRITKEQGPWPLDPHNFNIFLFGGSTTFGYGVPDNQTVASYLQGFLSEVLKRDARVYNFGRGHYYSTQERILLERLLVSGVIPDMAIFIDGLNDFYSHSDEPHYTDHFKEFVENRTRADLLRLLKRSMVFRTAISIKRRMDKVMIEQDSYKDAFIVTSVVERYLENKQLTEAITAIYGTQPIFVWQPAPTYKYDLNYHLFGQGGFGRHGYSRYGYQYMARLKEERPIGKNFLWCADIQEHLQVPLYVDKVHYSAEMSAMLAHYITNSLLERGFLKVRAQQSYGSFDNRCD